MRGFWLALVALLCGGMCVRGASAQTRTARRVTSATAQTSARRGAQRVANDFPGADLGAKINAADRALGDAPGEILVRGGGDIRTQVVLNSGHTLRFTAGTYRLLTEFLWEGAFLLRSNTTVVGSGWDTIFIEPPKVGWIVFQSFNDIKSQPPHSGTDSGINISSLQVHYANPNVEGGIRQTIELGNCHRCTVENVWLNQTGVIGVQAGGNAAAGNHAESVTIRNNQFTHVASQAVAVVNGRDILIEGNTFKDSGRCCAQSMSAIDIEPNNPDDIAERIQIVNNVIDSTHSGFLHGNGIVVQNGAGAGSFGPVLVKGNTIIGGPLVPNISGSIASGIIVAGNTRDVQVVDNTIQRVAHSGIRLEKSTRNYVANNRLVSTGTGGIISFEVRDTTDSQIVNNSVTVDPNSPLGVEVIQELGNSRNNSYRGNTNSHGALAPVTAGRRP